MTEDNASFEDAWVARHMARRPQLDTRDKQLVWAKEQLFMHQGDAQRWANSYRGRNVPSVQTNAAGYFRWSNRAEWQIRKAAWQRLICRLSVPDA